MRSLSGIAKAIALWGVITFVGFAIFQFWQPQPFFVNAMYVWIVLSIIGILAIRQWVPKWLTFKPVKVWVPLIIAGMIINAAQTFFHPPLLPLYLPYAEFWLLLMGVGYLLTGLVWPKNKKTYYVGGVLNLLLLVLLIVNVKPLGAYTFLLTGIVGAVPALYDGLTGYPQ